MRSYSTFLILVNFVIFYVCAQNVIETTDNDVESTTGDPLFEDATVSPINEAEEIEDETLVTPETDYCNRPCHRMYKPVCGSRNGIPFEMANMCVFESKVFCELSATKDGEKAAEFMFLYEGHCQSGKSTATRRNRVNDRKRYFY